MKNLRIQRIFKDDIFYIAYLALKHELGYLAALGDDIYQAPNFKIEVTSEKKNADYKINIISSEGSDTLFAKII